jgi:hypothetical protein
MKNELKVVLFCIAFLTDYALCLANERIDMLLISLAFFIIILAASAKVEKLEKRLQMYKDDADRRGREQMTAEEKKTPSIVMTRGKAS